ncbi:MAG: hypothetical protein ABI540_02600 [Spartobacteria bacterium]
MAVTGVGIDMVLYAALVLLCRADLKIAIPTSVVIICFTSVVGIVAKEVTTGLQAGVFENWLAGALGAPLGVFVVNVVWRNRPCFLLHCSVWASLWTCSTERAALGFSG